MLMVQTFCRANKLEQNGESNPLTVRSDGPVVHVPRGRDARPAVVFGEDHGKLAAGLVRVEDGALVDDPV